MLPDEKLTAMRILLDTNLLVRAAITPDGLARKLRRIEEGEGHVLVITSHLLGEGKRFLFGPLLRLSAIRKIKHSSKQLAVAGQT